MPTYQYRCTECGRDLEVVQKFSDPTLTECPSCQGQLRKIFNAVGVVFKGSGFYRTDSRKGSGDGSGSSDKADKAEKPGEKKSDAGTTEKKPEKKTETAGTSTKPAPSSTGSNSTAA